MSQKTRIILKSLIGLLILYVTIWFLIAYQIKSSFKQYAMANNISYKKVAVNGFPTNYELEIVHPIVTVIDQQKNSKITAESNQNITVSTNLLFKNIHYNIPSELSVIKDNNRFLVKNDKFEVFFELRKSLVLEYLISKQFNFADFMLANISKFIIDIDNLLSYHGTIAEPEHLALAFKDMKIDSYTTKPNQEKAFDITLNFLIKDLILHHLQQDKYSQILNLSSNLQPTKKITSTLKDSYLSLGDIKILMEGKSIMDLSNARTQELMLKFTLNDPAKFISRIEKDFVVGEQDVKNFLNDTASETILDENHQFKTVVYNLILENNQIKFGKLEQKNLLSLLLPLIFSTNIMNR